MNMYIILLLFTCINIIYCQHHVANRVQMDVGFINNHEINNATTLSAKPESALSRFAEDSVTNLVNAVGFYEKLNHSISWRDGLRHCESIKKRLCMLKDYCPHGVGKAPKPGLQAGEAWAPTSDGFNNWVYVGNNMKMSCNTYKKLHGSYPSWGRTSTKKSFKGNVYCCKSKMQKVATQTPKWDDANNFCQKQGKRLCSTSEYCPDGKHKAPVGGVLNAAAWAAVNDITNEWVSIGWSFPKKLLCRTHTSIASRRPKWGESATSGPKRGVLQCCDDKFINMKGKMVYAETDRMCKEMGKRLCYISEYCKDGKGKAPDGGSRHELSAWAPVGDRYNEWVGVGTRKEELCIPYSSLNSKAPVWGESKGAGTKGYIRCCKGPPPNKKKPKSPLKGQGEAVPVVDNMEPKAVTAEKESKQKSKQRTKRKEKQQKLLKKHAKTMKELRQKGDKLKYLQAKMIEKKQKRHASHEDLRKHELKKLKKLKNKVGYKKSIERAAKVRDAEISKARAHARAALRKQKHQQTKSTLEYTMQMQHALKKAELSTTNAIMKAQDILNAANTKELKSKPWVSHDELPVDPAYYPMGGSQYRAKQRLKRSSK